MGVVVNFILHSNHCHANRVFVRFCENADRQGCAPMGGSLNAKFRFKGTSPLTIFIWIEGPMNALQLCRWRCTHEETVQQTFF